MPFRNAPYNADVSNYSGEKFMKFRSILLSVVASMMLLFASVASAQDIDPCFGLSADDCATINAAVANGVGDATSFTLDYTIDFQVGGTGSLTDGEIESFKFANQGSIDLAQADGMFPINAGFVTAAQFDDLVGVGMNELAVEVRLLDGVAYLQDPMSGGWISLDLLETMASPEFNEALSDLPVDPNDPMGALDAAGLGDFDPTALFALVELIDLPGLIIYERAGDVFTFTIDLTALQVLNTPEYEEELNNLIEVASEIDPTAAFLIPTIPALVSEGTIEVVYTLDGDMLAGMDFYTNLDIALGMMTGDMSADPITVDLAFEMDIINLDAAAIPAVPEDATPISPEELGGLLGGF